MTNVTLHIFKGDRGLHLLAKDPKVKLPEGKWKHAGTRDFDTTKPQLIGLDLNQTLNDIEKNGYHVSSITVEMRAG